MTRRPRRWRLTRPLVALATLALVALPRIVVPVLAASATVVIGDTLDPASLQVQPGTTVTWTNATGDRHRMRTTSGPVEFDSGDLDPGKSFTVTLDTIGTYQYVDDRNRDLSNYWGTITVAEAPTGTPKPGTTPAPATPPPAPPPGDILMAGRAFSPASLTVDAGTAVRWRNNDVREHTVTASDRSFDSGVMAIGATFTKVFSIPGTYRYLCAIHPDMTGTIAVRTVGGATPPPPAPTPRPTPVVTPAPGSGTVQVVDFAFSPGSVDVVAGTTVTWVNTGAALHTVTASDGSFDSGLLAAGGGRFSRRFGTPGTYPYLCGLHPSMAGVVRVSGANGATPPPPAPPTPKPTAPPVAGGELELRDFAFVPSSIAVTPGTRVTWVNTGAAPHTVTDRAGSFDSGILVRGARFSRTFAVPGTYELLCSIHPDMHATLMVAAPGASAPPPATPPPVVTPPPDSGQVAIIDFDFAPASVHVAVGTTVRWTNGGVAPHTVTAKDGSFDSGFLNTGEVFSRQFTAVGVIEYLCAIHPAMIGTVVVGAPAASPPGALAGPSTAPSGSPAPPPAGAAGVPPDAGGAGPTILEAPSAPPSPESLVRLGVVGLLWLAGGFALAAVVRSSVRR